MILRINLHLDIQRLTPFNALASLILIQIHPSLALFVFTLAPTVAATLAAATAPIAIRQPNRLLKNEKVTLQHLSPVLHITELLEPARRSIRLAR